MEAKTVRESKAQLRLMTTDEKAMAKLKPLIDAVLPSAAVLGPFKNTRPGEEGGFRCFWILTLEG